MLKQDACYRQQGTTGARDEADDYETPMPALRNSLLPRRTSVWQPQGTVCLELLLSYVYIKRRLVRDVRVY